MRRDCAAGGAPVPLVIGTVMVNKSPGTELNGAEMDSTTPLLFLWNEMDDENMPKSMSKISGSKVTVDTPMWSVLPILATIPCDPCSPTTRSHRPLIRSLGRKRRPIGLGGQCLNLAKGPYLNSIV